jgi:hypothetical protein
MKFSISSSEMKKALNQSPDKLKELYYWGKNARIAHQVFIVMEASLADKFSKKFGLNLKAGVNGLGAEIGVGGSSSGTTHVTISKDTCFAYLLLRITWDKNKDNPTILDLNDDQWGAG